MRADVAARRNEIKQRSTKGQISDAKVAATHADGESIKGQPGLSELAKH
jgi:hypothetical protein